MAQQAKAAIVGGTDATQGQLPYMAFIVYQESSTTAIVCSGTVVSSNVVLTAGHCTVNEGTTTTLNPGQFAVVTGAVDWTDTSVRQVSGVSRVILDPNYDPANSTSDAALLVLSTPTTAPAVPLANSSDLGLEAPGTGAIIAGWGETYQGSGITANLEWAETVVQNTAYCSAHLSPPYSYDPALELCAVDYPYDDTGTCNGDSGGPMLAANSADKPVEIGITDLVPANCNTVSADYFTAVEPLSGWVSAEIAAVAPRPLTPPPAAPPSLPSMSAAAARGYAKKTLAGALRSAFRRRYGLRTSCARTSSIGFSCGVQFSAGANDYYGKVAVYYVSGSGGTVEWTDNYVLHWVNDYCYFKSGHRQRCKIHTKRGSF